MEGDDFVFVTQNQYNSDQQNINNILDTTSYKDYILVFNINNIDKDSNFIFRYVDNDRGIKISPEVIY